MATAIAKRTRPRVASTLPAKLNRHVAALAQSTQRESGRVRSGPDRALASAVRARDAAVSAPARRRRCGEPVVKCRGRGAEQVERPFGVAPVAADAFVHLVDVDCDGHLVVAGDSCEAL